MAGSFQHYRLSLLGQDLQETLEELINADLFNAELREVVMEHFGRAMTDALATQVRSKAVIKGAIKHYRNHDDIWRIFLKNIDMKIDGKGIESAAMTQMIAVSKR